MLKHFKDMQKIQEILQEAQTGLWMIELDEGSEPRMYADDSMRRLLGLKEDPSPEECYQTWYGRIDEEYYPMVQAAVNKLILDERAEVTYPWQHPEWGQIYVRCGGVRDWSYEKGICLRGYHQNITDTVVMDQEYDTVIQTLNESYTGILLCNLKEQTFKIVKMTKKFPVMSGAFQSYEDYFRYYVDRVVSPQYRELLLELATSQFVSNKFREGEKQIEVMYQNREGGWRRLKVVPSAQYTEESPWVIAAFDKQDGEMEKRMYDAFSRLAVAQIYKLVLSVDLSRLEYNCIFYSGSFLKIGDQGRFEDFYHQASSKMPSEDRQIVERLFDRDSYRKSDYLEGVLRLWGDDGNLHYYNYYAACVQQGTEERILLTIRNVDDKWEMRQREEVLSNLCKCYYSIYLFDLENNMEEAIWQEEAIEKSGKFPKGNLKIYYDRFISEFVYEEDREKMRRAGSAEFLSQVLSEEQSVYEIDFRRIYPKHTAWVRSRFSVAEMRDGKVTKVIFANMNINEQKLVELEEERKKKQYFEYQNVVRGLSSFYHSVFYVDLLDESFQAFKMRKDVEKNLEAESTAYESLKRAYRKLVHEEEQRRFEKELDLEAIRGRISGGDPIYALEYRRNYGGGYGWMRLHVILAESQNGMPVRIVLAAHSVEKEKEQEEQNRKALLAAYEAAKTANEAKSRFLAQMSHDIRTPMNVIMGMTAIAASHVEDPEKVRDCLRKIELSSGHLLELINEVLDMSRIEKGKIELSEEPFSLKELMEGVGAIMRTEATNKKQTIIFEEEALVHDRLLGDPARIRQVLLNLITNAVKYTPEKGCIQVAVQEVSGRVPGFGSFVFTVEDNGIGMSEDFINYIFVPFSRAEDAYVRKIQGTGLGMSIAQGIVTAMQGNIQVESEKGKGSRFVVTVNLKIADQEPCISCEADPWKRDEEGLASAAAMRAGKRILLVEDNELNMEIARTMLEQAGFEVDGAANGCEALRSFANSRPGTYDAILMDLQMPVMDGCTAARKIRSCGHPQAESIRVIALTANAFAEDIARALAAGMNDHVSKPIDYHRLLAVLEKE